MTDRALRARILLEEAAALGVGLADLIAADAEAAPMPTVAEYVSTIAGTFGPATAATCWPSWRLTITHLGDRRLAEVTVLDLQIVVAEVMTRAKRYRPTSNGRSSQETCVAALRALFSRARAAGVIRADPVWKAASSEASDPDAVSSLAARDPGDRGRSLGSAARGSARSAGPVPPDPHAIRVRILGVR